MSEFLTEAKVLVRPDTKAFGAILAAELKTIQAALPPFMVPITATVAPVAGAAAAIGAIQTAAAAATTQTAKSGAAAVNALVAATSRATATTADLARIQKIAAASTSDLARSELAATNAAGALGAAQIRASFAIREVGRQEQILATALSTGNAALIRAAALTSVLTIARQRETAATLAAARAEGSHSSSLGATTSGARGAGLSLIGLRGAMLGASGAFLAGTTAVLALGKSLQSFASLQTELNVFVATTGATADELERVSAAATQLGADITLPAVTAGTAARAMTELAKAGLTVEEAMEGARGVLQLSTAASIDTAQAAEFAANALNAFGLAGDQAVRVADVLANASNAAQGSISDFGLAFQQAAAVARQVGFSLEETAATLTILAQSGLRGSDAGTSLRVALLRLVNPTAKAAEVIKSLGIQIRDAEGNIRPDVFVQFGEATRNFTPAMRDAAFATVFGADAIRAVAIAAREGRTGLFEVTEQIGQQGTAAELAGARTAGLAGQYEGLKSNLDTTAISLGKVTAVLAGPLVVAASAATKSIGLLLLPLVKLIDLGGKLTGAFAGASFDPSSASAGEFLARIEELQKAYGNLLTVAGAPQSIFLNTAQQAIQALEAERSRLKALGLDTTAVTILIQGLQDEIRNIKGAGKDAAGSLTPLQKAARDTRELIKAAAAAGIDTGPLKRSLREIEVAMLDVAEKARFRGQQLSDNFNAGAKDLGVPVRNILLELQEEALDIDIAGGSPGSQIGNLREQEAQLRKKIEALAGAPKKRLEAKEELSRILDEIKTIQESIRSDAESKANEIKEASARADQAVVDALLGGRTRTENLLARAEATPGVGDDIKFTGQLRNILKNQLAQALKRINDVKARKAFIDATNRLLITLLNDMKADRRKLAADARDALKDDRERVQAGIQLDIEFASINENVKAEIAARRRLIAQYKKAQQAAKGNINEVKRYRNLIAEEQAAIEELAGQKKESKNAFGELAFQFLQTQQGFAANLLGNLIPGFATGGLVGGPQAQAPENLVSPTAKLQAQAGAGGVTGPTFGQAATEVDILKEMLRVLKVLAGGRAHPEAKYEYTVAQAMLDFGSGGN